MPESDELQNSIDRTQAGEEIERWLRANAEKGYRPYPCPNCGRQRAYVCNDGHLRCEKCSVVQSARTEDLADVFSSLEKYHAAAIRPLLAVKDETIQNLTAEVQRLTTWNANEAKLAQQMRELVAGLQNEIKELRDG
jgi:hypothetical protein